MEDKVEEKIKCDKCPSWYTGFDEVKCPKCGKGWKRADYGTSKT